MWDVAGRQLLQPAMEARLSRRRAHPGDGSGAYESSLDDGGAVDVSDTTREVTQMARTEAEVAAGGRACSLTTVQCGATQGRHGARDSPTTSSLRGVLVRSAK